MAYRELLLGCGHSRVKKISTRHQPHFENLTTLDLNPDCRPDVEWDLSRPDPLPFGDDTFDEIHAYEVLEHVGAQGDFKTLFWQFEDYWRVLKPGGQFAATVPRGDLWTWGDPGHRRMINSGTLAFLVQTEYIKQCDTLETRTNMCDYRRWYRADFDVFHIDDGNANPAEFMFVLFAVKPSRLK